MNLDLSTALSISGFLFTLVGLLSSVFLISISKWLSEIYANGAKWELLKNLDPESLNYGERLSCYYHAKEACSWVTWVSWVIITGFLFYVQCSLFFFEIEEESLGFYSTYIKWPSTIFYTLYVGFTGLFLILGYRRSRGLLQDFYS